MIIAEHYNINISFYFWIESLFQIFIQNLFLITLGMMFCSLIMFGMKSRGRRKAAVTQTSNLILSGSFTSVNGSWNVFRLSSLAVNGVRTSKYEMNNLSRFLLVIDELSNDNWKYPFKLACDWSDFEPKDTDNLF